MEEATAPFLMNDRLEVLLFFVFLFLISIGYISLFPNELKLVKNKTLKSYNLPKPTSKKNEVVLLSIMTLSPLCVDIGNY